MEGVNMPRLTLTLFGPPNLARDGQALHLRSRKCLALLAYLAVTGRVYRRDRIAALLWPDSDAPRAQNSLRNTLSLLRRALNGTWLVVDRETIGLDGSEREAVDVVRFRDLLSECQRHEHGLRQTCAQCLPLLEEAVGLCEGNFMSGFTLPDSAEFDDWQAVEGGALQRELSEALERLAEGYAAQGEMEKAIIHAHRWLGLDPLQEGAHRALMRLYAETGRRTEALQQYEACERVLRERLDVFPSTETRDLYQIIRGGRMPQVQLRTSMASAAPPRPRHNLPPQPTPFVGREEELDQIAQRLADPTCRLLTLVGPGGIGKSRLAIQAAEEHLSAFSDGVWFVPLASVGSVDLLPSTIMEALDIARSRGTTPKEQLLNYLRDRTLLLVLDGFEELLEGTTLVTELLRTAPGIRLLVTSRERLNLRGEWLFPLRGMEVPEEETVIEIEKGGVVEQATAILEGYSALQLFVQCAQQVQPEFSLGSTELASVTRICRLVEGMPLAIELAAPWMRVMDCEEIAQEIEGGLDLLTTALRDVPARHRSMRAVFDHSWGLLSAEERQVLRQLSVFRGGFRREAAEAVAGVSLLALSALVDRSWIQRPSSGRYEMHELVRQYCAESLQEKRAQADEVRDRHGHYYGVFLQEREERLQGGGQAEAFGEILEEIDNVWAAWGWALERADVETINSCVETLAYAGLVRSWDYEVLQAFDDAAAVLRRQLDLAECATGPVGQKRTALVLADILSKQVLLLEWFGQGEPAVNLCGESLALLEHVESSARSNSVTINAWLTLGRDLVSRGERDEGERLLQEALALSERAGTPWDREHVLFWLSLLARSEGRYSQAEGYLRQAIAVAGATGERFWKAACLDNLSMVLRIQGEYREAQMAAQESLRIREEISDRRNRGFSLTRLGEIATALGDYELARQHFQRGLTVAEEIGVSDPDIKIGILRGQATLSLALGQPEEAARLFGNSLTITLESGSLSGQARALSGLGHAALAVGQVRQARERFCQGLEVAMRGRRLPLALRALAGLAAVMVSDGDPERAAEILGLVLHHPATHQLDKDRAQNLLAELESELPPEVVAAATARGQMRELEEVVAEILERTDGE